MPSKDSDRDLRINLPEDWELRVFGVSAGWSWSLFNHRLLTSIAPRERGFHTRESAFTEAMHRYHEGVPVYAHDACEYCVFVGGHVYRRRIPWSRDA